MKRLAEKIHKIITADSKVTINSKFHQVNHLCKVVVRIGNCIIVVASVVHVHLDVTAVAWGQNKSRRMAEMKGALESHNPHNI